MTNEITNEMASNCFAAMGAPVRLQILSYLVKAGNSGRPVSAIQEHLNMPGSTLNHHLQALADAGLIIRQKQGRTILSQANFSHLEGLADFILAACCSEENADG